MTDDVDSAATTTQPASSEMNTDDSTSSIPQYCSDRSEPATGNSERLLSHSTELTSYHMYNRNDDQYNNYNNNNASIMSETTKSCPLPTPSSSPTMTTTMTSSNFSTTGTTATTTDKWQTLASVAGNVLEWFDFAIFGYLSDILGEVFFPSSTISDTVDDNTTTKQQTMESFFVFGLAFLMRPIGGLLFGYIGDYYGRKKALVISILTMAFPTFLMGTLPGYKSVGRWAIVFLVLVRLLQGLSVGGQLISSLVYLLENKNPDHWGFYGSFTMAAAIL